MFSNYAKDTMTTVKNEDHPLLSHRHIAFQLIGGGNNIFMTVIFAIKQIYSRKLHPLASMCTKIRVK